MHEPYEERSIKVNKVLTHFTHTKFEIFHRTKHLKTLPGLGLK